MSKNGRQGTSAVSPSIADQLEGVDDAAKSAIITRAVDDQNLLMKARELVSYGEPTFAVADGSVSERFGRKSVPVITVVVPIALLGIKFTSTIWGRLENKTDGSVITFEASMPKDVKPIDATGKDRLLAHVENTASQWGSPVKLTNADGSPMLDENNNQVVVGSEYLKATTSAEARLMGVKAPTIAGQLGRPTLRKRVVLASETART